MAYIIGHDSLFWFTISMKMINLAFNDSLGSNWFIWHKSVNLTLFIIQNMKMSRCFYRNDWISRFCDDVNVFFFSKTIFAILPWLMWWQLTLLLLQFIQIRVNNWTKSAQSSRVYNLFLVFLRRVVYERQGICRAWLRL